MDFRTSASAREAAVGAVCNHLTQINDVPSAKTDFETEHSGVFATARFAPPSFLDCGCLFFGFVGAAAIDEVINRRDHDTAADDIAQRYRHQV